MICCNIARAADGAHSMSVHEGTKIRWTGNNKALIMGPKKTSADELEAAGLIIPYKFAEESLGTGTTV